MSAKSNLKKYLLNLYNESGESLYRQVLEKISQSLEENQEKSPRREMTERDLLLITYAQQIQSLESPDKKPLQLLSDFYHQELRAQFSGLHILPFYPSTSDGGFAVKAYDEVDPAFGAWEDILGFQGDLMFDAVFNHTSSEHPWFQEWLNENPDYDHFYHHFSENPEPGSECREQLDEVVRPRSSDLLQPFKRKGRDVYVWATFGSDQIDVNFSNPQVFLAFVDTLLLYVKKGATLLRIDAVPFLWKELGTNCMHLEQTHTLVKAFRTILDLIKPDVSIVTESNVPHEENISYLGNGSDEAQMVYNFSLAPLIMHALVTQDGSHLKRWVEGLKPLKPENYFFNFTSTHDGLGVRPLEGILSDEQVQEFADILKQKGGMVSDRSFAGVKKPYEVNITWASALSDEDPQLHIQKIISSYAMSFVFPGVPGVYFHNLLGTLNWTEGYEKSQHKRDVNRRMYDKGELQRLMHEHPFHSQVYQRTLSLLEKRRQCPCLHPKASFSQLPSSDNLWIVRREWQGKGRLFIFNLTDQPATLSDPMTTRLGPYEFLWDVEEHKA